MCLQIYEFDFIRLLTVPGSEWKAALKNAKVKLHLWTDTDILLVIGKGSKGRTCYAIFWYVKANNKYIANYDRNK